MYSKYKKNYFSQNGEDGIIEKIISDLKITEKYSSKLSAFGIPAKPTRDLPRNALLCSSRLSSQLDKTKTCTTGTHASLSSLV